VKKYDNVLMINAKSWAKQSYCNRKKVGAVLAKDGRILATGYNGTISGTENCCEEKCDVCNGTGRSYLDDEEYCPRCNGGGKITNDFTLHAEQNIITFCAKEGIPTKDTTIYITLSPCKTCAKLIAQSGIKRVVYNEQYRDTSGVDFLKNLGIQCEQHNTKGKE